ncbi:DNA invertase Pin-like site-specific DNA recombinase [Sphingobium wenxiniae]|uniref:DNA invertase Pin-like site-specific DNA recombinase n=1 Tax=Sphingobium wenxiniae (strain DSM 21828 / CGMCC 1.7748 / JZ-1) TaxID=595605 RepID=A0A562K4F3_SPHWJ|nr:MULTISPECIES: recombinase family protein [Sphingobium]MBB6193079.1 DNA invertase Pin-like site-specific DNA recombinase [Sphingobium wenxiniae]TWH90287.1 DNA invertase Pin-like site-specific DNA recombinase [Sphingobium wenxiniae]|tara:strand:+ start:5341 stop:5979 length:639 start_codon:yes stop_codon:yes gene_type:complete
MLIGYARVSTYEQNARLQIEALEQAGCTKVFTDEGVSGSAVIKPQLAEALAYARADEDTLVVWKLDRLSRSTRDLIDTVQGMKERGIGLRSIKESVIDTTSAAGNLIFQIFGAFAEFERGTNHERTMAGIAAAQRAGTRFGRPQSIKDAQWIEAKKHLTGSTKSSVAAVATMLGVSRQAIYRRMERDRAEQSDAERQADPSPAASQADASAT